MPLVGFTNVYKTAYILCSVVNFVWNKTLLLTLSFDEQKLYVNYKMLINVG